MAAAIMSQTKNLSIVKTEETSEVITMDGIKSDTSSEMKVTMSVLESDVDSPSSPIKQQSPMSDISSPSMSRKSSVSSENFKTEIIKGEVSMKMERGDSQSKLSRTASQRVTKRSAPLFDDLPDKSDEAKKTFKVIKGCSYDPKWLADSGQEEEAMSCECKAAFDGSHNNACGEHSDCINRIMCMECSEDDATCGGTCRNQRFQNREYANVSVIQTEKKGYGLRTNVDLEPNTFIYEYVGEVIDEPKFRQRTQQYGDEGIKHFYFMSIKKGEFVDATKKGGFARFCNHSCNPNCMVEKWVVGNKLRMGIFANVFIKAGEELTFDYNVDRYGAEPQACFCGEPNCIGYIGGKTQTEAATKLPALFVEALGIDDADGWRTATAKKPKRRKGEDDEDYVSNFKARPLEKDSVQKVMGSLLQSKERWIVIRLLDRIQLTEDMAVQAEVMRIHGYQIFNSILREWNDDPAVVVTVLEILNRWPALTKNKISSSKIELAVKTLVDSEDERLRSLAEGLISSWSKLEMGYRIPRKARVVKEDKASKSTPERKDSTENSRSRSRSPEPARRTPTGPKNTAPTGPKNSVDRPPFSNHHQPHRPHRPPHPRFNSGFNPPTGPRQPNRLPMGWATATDANGKVYYYNIATSATQWDFPKEEVNVKPPPPPTPAPLPATLKSLELQKIIDGINASPTVKSADAPPKVLASTSKTVTVTSEKKLAKFDEAKAKAVLTKVFAKVVPNFVARFEKDIGGRDEVKRYAKKIVTQLVDKEIARKGESVCFEMTEMRKKKVKDFVMKMYMPKVVIQYKALRAVKAARKAAAASEDTSTPMEDASPQETNSPNVNDEASPIDASPSIKDEESSAVDFHSCEATQMPTPHTSTPLDYKPSSATPSSPKRKRDEGEEFAIVKESITATYTVIEEASRPTKRTRSNSQSPSRASTPEAVVVTAV